MLGFGAVALIAILIAVAVTVITHSYLVRQLDDRLASFAGPTRVDQPVMPMPRNLGDEITRASDAMRGFLTTDGDMHVFLQPNVEGTDELIPVVDVGDLDNGVSTYLTAETDGGTSVRVLARPAGDGWDITALSMESVTAVTQRLIVIESVGIVAMLAGLGLVAAWVIRMGLAPMRRMVESSGRIAAGDLSVRVDEAGQGREAAELAVALNAMIGTLTGSIEERQRSEARLREFIADASHELRTPLTTVLGYAELHRRGALTSEDSQDDAWSRTESEAQRMRRLVSDMLELAKYDAEPEVMRAPVDAGALAAEVASDAATAHPHARFSVTSTSAGMVMGDADRLRQALLNVVTNAATHGGTHVTIQLSSDAPWTRVIVADDGPGMSPEIAERATERFVRADSSRSRRHGGAGLGLAITAAIVHAHAGTLAIRSVQGAGTTVTISLPAPDADESVGESLPDPRPRTVDTLYSDASAHSPDGHARGRQ